MSEEQDRVYIVFWVDKNDISQGLITTNNKLRALELMKIMAVDHPGETVMAAVAFKSLKVSEHNKRDLDASMKEPWLPL